MLIHAGTRPGERPILEAASVMVSQGPPGRARGRLLTDFRRGNSGRLRPWALPSGQAAIWTKPRLLGKRSGYFPFWVRAPE